LKNQKIVISDGASQSYMSGEWAHFLTENLGELNRLKFYRKNEKLFFKSFVEQSGLYIKWKNYVDIYKNERNAKDNPLKWYEDEGIQSGADATVLGIYIHENSEGNYWEACAVGDTCLFFIQNDALKYKFPIQRSQDFNNTPPLISSVERNNLNIANLEKKIDKQQYNSGDILYLMTDALAKWFLKEFENGREPWRIIDETVLNKETYSEWIGNLRKSQSLENDDTTLLRIGFN
jgi:hypothetical protein